MCYVNIKRLISEQKKKNCFWRRTLFCNDEVMEWFADIIVLNTWVLKRKHKCSIIKIEITLPQIEV